jgi:membrane protein YqaA with SNARE-associated domain
MEETLLQHGYPALFLLGFLAATLLPLGSEWLLAALLLKGLDPVTCVAVATAGNTLGALVNYAMGLWGGVWLTSRLLRVAPDSRLRAERFYARYGVWSLLLAWVPVIGDPLCLVGGVLRVRWSLFLLLVAIGKYARYQVLAWAVLAAA